MTLDTVADESRKKMADDVTRSPSRLCSRDEKICYYEDALSTIFLLLCLASYFSYFSPASRYVYLRRVPSSVQQSSATLSMYYTYFIVYVFFLLVSFVSRLFSEFLCF